jgi:hypothetical protein
MSTYIEDSSELNDEYEEPIESPSNEKLESDSYKDETPQQKPASDYSLDLAIGEQDSEQELITVEDVSYLEDRSGNISGQEVSRPIRESEALERRIRNVSEQMLDEEFEQRTVNLLRTSDDMKQVIVEISDEQSRRVVRELLDSSDSEATDEVRLTSRSEVSEMVEAVHGEVEGLHGMIVNYIVWPASLVFAAFTTGLAVLSIAGGSIVGLPFAVLSLLFWVTAARLFMNDDVYTPLI